jgi:phosphoribosylglycinamide formyltransferase 1
MRSARSPTRWPPASVAEPLVHGRPARLAVFASGRGSNLAALLAAFPPPGHAGGAEAIASVRLVVSDRREAGALTLARDAGLPALHLPFGRDRDAFETAAQAELLRARIDLIALAGFMRILSPDFAAHWRGRLLNVHPSLLPAFPGLHPVRRALEAGVDRTGCTVHFVDAGVDTGPIVVRHEVPVLAGDDEAALRARIQRAEHVAYPEAIRAVVRGDAQPAAAPGGPDVRAPS